jgi:hypothetical protein
MASTSRLYRWENDSEQPRRETKPGNVFQMLLKIGQTAKQRGTFAD